MKRLCFRAFVLLTLLLLPAICIAENQQENLGIELAWFPIEESTLTINQSSDGFCKDYGGTGSLLSHIGKNQYALDLAGYVHVFAPFDMIIIRGAEFGGNANTVCIQSINEVLWADGEIDYIHFLLAHDNVIFDLPTGREIKKGELFYTGGTAGTNGAHLHIEVGRGKFTQYATYTWNGNDGIYLFPAVNPAKTMFFKPGIIFERSYYTEGTVEEGGFNFQKWNQEIHESLVSLNAKQVDSNSAVLNGLLYYGEEKPSNVGFIIWNEGGSKIDLGKKMPIAKIENEMLFDWRVTNDDITLIPDATYFFQAYATYSNKTMISKTQSFVFEERNTPYERSVIGLPSTNIQSFNDEREAWSPVISSSLGTKAFGGDAKDSSEGDKRISRPEGNSPEHISEKYARGCLDVEPSAVVKYSQYSDEFIALFGHFCQADAIQNSLQNRSPFLLWGDSIQAAKECLKERKAGIFAAPNNTSIGWEKRSYRSVSVLTSKISEKGQASIDKNMEYLRNVFAAYGITVEDCKQIVYLVDQQGFYRTLDIEVFKIAGEWYVFDKNSWLE